MAKREYIMSKGTLNRLKHSREVTELKCHHPNCKECINVGDAVISKSSSNGMGNRKQNIYHKQCYLDSFI